MIAEGIEHGLAVLEDELAAEERYPGLCLKVVDVVVAVADIARDGGRQSDRQVSDGRASRTAAALGNGYKRRSQPREPARRGPKPDRRGIVSGRRSPSRAATMPVGRLPALGDPWRPR